jgi:hypothetical protein
MKSIIGFSILLMLLSCNSNPDNKESGLESKVNSLQEKLDNMYKPGLGEFMTGIQLHHSKLWFAGTNDNWKLADFEINEIKEALSNIRQFNVDRQEVQSIGMIDPAIDSISKAIVQRDLPSFKRGYILLTNTCNNCHRATKHEFNVITIPSIPPVSNQQFKPTP